VTLNRASIFKLASAIEICRLGAGDKHKTAGRMGLPIMARARRLRTERKPIANSDLRSEQTRNVMSREQVAALAAYQG